MTLLHLGDVVIGDPAPPTSSSEPPRVRRRRRRIFSAVLVVLAVAAALSMTASHDGPRARQHTSDQQRVVTTTPITPERPGPKVRLFDYTFRLPGGVTIVHHSVIEIVPAQPPQPVGGRDAYVSARGSRAGLDVTVFRGPIAAAEADVVPPAPGRLHPITVAGLPATVDAYGAGPSGPSSREVRVRVSSTELIWVDSEGVPTNDVVAMLEAALAG